MKLGLGYRRELGCSIASAAYPIDFVEFVAEHYFDGFELPELTYPNVVHALGLSIGSDDALCERYLAQIKDVVARSNCMWLSEHLAQTGGNGVDLGHLNPFFYTKTSFNRVANKLEQLQNLVGVPVLLENITTSLMLPGQWSEPVFLSKLAQTTGAGILLDVTNLFVNSRNHGYDPNWYLDNLDVDRVMQIHLIGYSHSELQLTDEHAEAVQPELLNLLTSVLERTGPVPILVEWDNHIPSPAVMSKELNRVRRCIGDA